MPASTRADRFGAVMWCRLSFAHHLAQVAFEYRRRLVQLIGEAGQVLQLADRLLGLPHAVGRRIHLAAEEIGILPVDRHFGERLDLTLETIELNRNKLGVLPGAAVVVEPQLAAGHAVLQRPDDAFVASLRRLERPALFREA